MQYMYQLLAMKLCDREQIKISKGEVMGGMVGKKMFTQEGRRLGTSML